MRGSYPVLPVVLAAVLVACGDSGAGALGGGGPGADAGFVADGGAGGDASAGGDAGAAPDSGGGADADAAPAPKTAYVYVASGAYGKSADNNIYGFSLDLATGALTPHGVLVAAGNNPTFMTFDTARAFAYVTNESGAAVASFAIDPGTFGLTLKDRVSSGGAGPTFVALDHAGSHLFVANYTAGSLAVAARAADGSLGSIVTTKSFGGTAETHCAKSDANDAHLFVVDKGLDAIAEFDFDVASGSASPHTPAQIAFPQGSGPRHLEFHPSGRFAYVVTENASTLVACTYDAASGTLTPMQTVSTLPQGFTGTNTGAEVQVAPSGEFVYASNRGDDSIAVFAIDGATGKVTPKGQTKTGGKTPRHFIVDATGKWLLAGNLDSDTVTVFRVDATTGALTPAGSTNVPSPGFVGVVER